MLSNNLTPGEALRARKRFAATCAICDGPIPRFLNHEGWVNNVQIISETQDCQLPGKRVFVSGRAVYNLCCKVTVWAGNDPCDPLHGVEGRATYIVYEEVDNQPFAFPFHTACYKILCECLRSKASQSLDNEVLYRTMKALCIVSWKPLQGGLTAFDSLMMSGQNFIKALAIPKYPGKPWNIRQNNLFAGADPAAIPEMAAYCTQLPLQTQQTQTGAIPVRDPRDPKLDIFEHLPSELHYIIASAASMASLNCLRAASPAIHRLKLDSAFWKHRLSIDMAWSRRYGIPDYTSLPTSDASQTVDWARVYRDLLRKSDSSLEKRQESYVGLVNRSRIWARCEQFLKHYFVKQEQLLRIAPPTSESCEGAACTRMPRLLHPHPQDSDPFTIVLFDDFKGVTEAQPVLQITWTCNMEELGNMKLLKNGCKCRCTPLPAVSTSLITSYCHSHSTAEEEIVVFPKHAWLTAIVITSREDSVRHSQCEPFRSVIGLSFVFTNGQSIQAGQGKGDKRLLQVPEGHFAVGFRGEAVIGGRVSKLAMLSQPIWKLPSILGQRIPPSIEPPRALEMLQKYLWRGAIPSPSLDIKPLTFRFFNSIDPPFYLRSDLAAMEPLIFGTTEDELSDITGISADEGFGGFQVHYAHRATRSIGPRMYAVKSLSIDGAGGERIFRIYYSMFSGLGDSTRHMYLAKGWVRFVTNRGRQLIVGQPFPDRRFEKKQPPAIVGGESSPAGFLAGFYGWWSSAAHLSANDTGKIDRFDAIGAFLSRDLKSASAPTDLSIEDRLLDWSMYSWEPSPPPSSWLESGDVVGHIPTRLNTVSWIDLQRPLQGTVAATACYLGRWFRRMAPLISGLTCTYANDTGTGVQTIRRGVGHLPEHPEVPDTADQQMCAPCRLTSIRVWLAKEDLYLVDGSLLGLQLIYDNGVSGSRFGMCEGPFTTVLSLNGQDGKEKAVGLKIFFGPIHISPLGGPLTQPSVLVGIQAMTLRS
ncbi:hypothetical protein N0V93_006125 [Gnomoniopsis smithogilvyi]|uniref:F-box domain-containing protein n=1 Tax=Gnomoniopsis smithogilvyi TaxID=1191159 RepID=A0A9W8YP15_9PEZI|nr:hypothetical protein N0V93_006125 [Gnomoniopsis smithogilvyi]